LVNASFHRGTHNAYKGHVVPISTSALAPGGPTVHVPSLRQSTSGRGSRSGTTLDPLSRPRANGYTPEHQQYSAQLSRFKSAAYAKSGDVITVQVSICYKPYGKKALVELSPLADVIKDMDAHSPIPVILQIIIDLALKKLEQHERELGGPGF
ncbi:hypothetical protein AAF712_016818, partial [Marasmius tenuissimus]